jgi:hypothetical protein
MWDRLWTNGRLATMAPGRAGQPYGAIGPGAIAARDGRIAFAGEMADLPDAPEGLARAVHDLEGRWVTPGLSTATPIWSTAATGPPSSSCASRAPATRRSRPRAAASSPR